MRVPQKRPWVVSLLAGGVLFASSMVSAADKPNIH